MIIGHGAFREFLANNRNTTWTGYGASYALAATISTTLRRTGLDIKLRRPREIVHGYNTVLVSQSGNAELTNFGFLLAGTSAIRNETTPSLLVNDSDLAQEWFPITFQARALTAVGEILQLAYPNIQIEESCEDSICLILDDCADVLQLLVTSACHKCPDLRLLAVPIDDFAHGAHASTLHSGEVYIVTNKLTRKHNLIAEWLHARGRPVRIFEPAIESPASWPLFLHATVLNVIAAHAGARGLDLSRRPITPDNDGLRAILASNDGEPK